VFAKPCCFWNSDGSSKGNGFCQAAGFRLGCPLAFAIHGSDLKPGGDGSSVHKHSEGQKEDDGTVFRLLTLASTVIAIALPAMSSAQMQHS